ncbi:MAG: glutamate 5-kinase, partial [Deltaproteobacteria bacterium]|nr:glutamate 5-kinase [Deltaproteobacteria bacterium]
TTIADGRVKNIITRLMNGEKLGTTVLPSSKKIEAKRKWISLLMKSSGSIVIDNGAVSAVLKKKSLLAAGIVSVSGAFKQGEVVSIMDTGANQIGKGITNYSVTDIEKIKGKKSLQINSSLGYKKGDEIIHRDNLVIIEE